MRYTFCPICAEKLEMRPSEPPDPDRPTCPHCGFVHYGNPAPTVQAWIESEGRYLALRRNQDPFRGQWNLPGGFVEAGEGGEEAIRREVREETGLEIEIAGVIGIFSSSYGEGEEALPILDIAYRARLAGGQLAVAPESSEAAWFALDDFPRPAFAGERAALKLLRTAGER